MSARSGQRANRARRAVIERCASSTGVCLLALAVWGCRAREISGVECGRDSDCGVAAACVELSCRPAAAIVSGRDGGLDGFGARTLLDDFDRPGSAPDDARFGSWVAGVFASEDCKDGQTGRAEATVIDGRLELQWEVTDSRDGKECYPAVGVTTQPVLATIDLSGYERLSFTMRHSPGEATCVSATQAEVSFVCEPVLYGFVFPAPSTWQTISVPWSDLAQPEWVDANAVSLDECLRRIETISFAPIPNMRDGQCQGGALSVDSVWLHVPPPAE